MHQSLPSKILNLQSSIVNARANADTLGESSLDMGPVPPVPPVPPSDPLNPRVIPPFPANFLLEHRPRRDDKIANMSPEDREALLHWMECGHSYRHIVELAAKPRPEGLDIKLSASMLCRFQQKYAIADQLEDAVEIARQVSPDATQARPQHYRRTNRAR